MNKKEQAAMTDLEEQLARARAMRLSGFEKPQSITYEEVKAFQTETGKALMTGWFVWTYNGQYRVTEGCSNGNTHNSHGTNQTTTQTMGVFYRTRREGLIVARLLLEQEMSATLAKLDKELAEA